MARTKRVSYEEGQGQGVEGSSEPPRTPRVKHIATKKSREKDEGAGSSRKRKREEKGKGKASEASQLWVESIRTRDVKCERQINTHGLLDHPAFKALERKGLDTFMTREMEYDLEVVRDFYAEMHIDRRRGEVRATVSGKAMTLTPDSVATWMSYTRPPPDSVLFPRRPMAHPYDRTELVRELSASRTEWSKGPLGMGQLKPHYQLLAKILQYNVFPRGNFKRLGLREAELLVACYTTEATVDYASWIWQEVVDFATVVNPKMVLPYPTMITCMARDAGVPIGPLTKGKPGPISRETVMKAKAQSSVRHGVADDFEPDPSLGVLHRIEQWTRAQFQRQTELIQEVRELRHRVDFVMEVAEEQSFRRYVPPSHVPAGPPQPHPPSPPAESESGSEHLADESGDEEHDEEAEASEASEDSRDGDSDFHGDE